MLPSMCDVSYMCAPVFPILDNSDCPLAPMNVLYLVYKLEEVSKGETAFEVDELECDVGHGQGQVRRRGYS